MNRFTCFSDEDPDVTSWMNKKWRRCMHDENKHVRDEKKYVRDEEKMCA